MVSVLVNVTDVNVVYEVYSDYINCHTGRTELLMSVETSLISLIEQSFSIHTYTALCCIHVQYCYVRM